MFSFSFLINNFESMPRSVKNVCDLEILAVHKTLVLTQDNFELANNSSDFQNFKVFVEILKPDSPPLFVQCNNVPG